MLEILDQTQRCPSPEALHHTLEALMSELGVADKELTLVLTNDPEMQRLNLEHRGVDAPTDVLSYPLFEPGDESFPEVPHLGDVIISLDTAQKQAEAQGHTLDAEVVTLAAHGLTHLIGFDHPTEAAWEIFRKNQRRAVALLGRSHPGG